MIFRPELVERILAHGKTQTRRVIRPGRPCRYRPGRTYAVQPGRTRRGVARIRITAVRAERLSRITSADARDEGFDSIPAFFLYWDRLHGPGSDRRIDVWVISFVLDADPPEPPDHEDAEGINPSAP